MGASAVKILLYYSSSLPENAASQQKVIRDVAANCNQQQIPFLVEPIVYPDLDSERDPATFGKRKPQLVIQVALDLTPLGVDVLKAQFPVDLTY